jgi:uncharacterized protein (DUF2062 family)
MTMASSGEPRSLFQRRVVAPLVGLLAQGVTPEKLALSLAFGLVISCCPLLGSTTALCALAAFAFRLNPVAIQVVNYAAYPLQLALLLPFWSLGARLFGGAPVPLLPSEVAALFRADFWGASRLYGGTALRGAALWLLIAPPAILVAQRPMLWLLRRVWRR